MRPLYGRPGSNLRCLRIDWRVTPQFQHPFGPGHVCLMKTALRKAFIKHTELYVALVLYQVNDVAHELLFSYLG